MRVIKLTSEEFQAVLFATKPTSRYTNKELAEINANNLEIIEGLRVIIRFEEEV